MVAKLMVMGPWEGPGEKMTAEFLVKNLPDGWLIYAGRKLDGGAKDVDFIIVGPNGLYVASEKFWGPRVEVHEIKWKVIKSDHISYRDNPINEISATARKIASWLKQSIPLFERQVSKRVVIETVVMSQPNLDMRLNPNDPNEGPKLAQRIRKLEHYPDYLKHLDNELAGAGFSKVRDDAISLVQGLDAKDLTIAEFGEYSNVEELPSYNNIRFFKGESTTTGHQCFLTAYPYEYWGQDPNFIAREKSVLDKLQDIGRSWDIHTTFQAETLNMFVVVVREPRNFFPLDEYLRAWKNSNDEEAGWTQQAIDFFSALAQGCFIGLSEIHAAGVWHKLLTPDRIWIGRNNEIRLRGFVSSHIDEERSVFLPDADPAFQKYASPEVALLPSAKSDVWSMARILVEQFELIGSLDGLSDDNPTRLAASEVRDILQQCLEDNPDQRFEAHEVAQLLSQASVGGTRAAEEETRDDISELKEGDTLKGRYYLLEMLGTGRFGTTWKAEDLESYRSLCTIKIHKSAEALDIARGEHHRSQTVSFEGLQRFRTFSPEPNFGFSELEYVPGTSLDKIRFNTAQEIKDVFFRVCEAIEYLHSRGLAHGDISPGNIICDQDGKVCLIDPFYTTLGSQLRMGTPAYISPEVRQTRLASEPSDVFSLCASFVKVILSRSALSIQDGTPSLRDLTEVESVSFEPEEVAVIRALLMGCEPNPENRPSSIDEIRDLVLNAAPVKPEDLPRLEDQQQINPNVQNLRQVYRGTKVGATGMLGIGSQFARETYVETLLDKKLIPEVLSGKTSVFFLTGNAGDGKTSFLNVLGDYLTNRGAISDTEINEAGWSLGLDGKKFLAIFDASESAQGQSSKDQLDGALTEALAGSTVLIAINDGRLKRYLSHELGGELLDKLEAAEIDIDTVASGYFERGQTDFAGVQVVNLKSRSLENLNKTGLLSHQISKFTDDALWVNCNSCSSRGRCPVFSNKEDLRTKFSTGVSDLALISHLRRRKRFTFRDARSALAWMITADLGCEDVHSRVERGQNPALDDDLRIHNLAFDSTSQDSLVQEWSEFDPALMHNGLLSGEVDRKRSVIGQRAITRSFLEREARRAFFGASDVLGEGVRIAPYKYLEQVIQFLSGETSDQLLKTKILLGYSRIVGPQRYASEGLAVSTSLTKAGNTLLKVLSASDFTLSVAEKSADAEYLETIPEVIELTYKDRWSLKLGLDGLELLLRSSDGEIMGSPKTSSLAQEMRSFATRISILATSEVMVQRPDGELAFARRDGRRIRIGESK
jgi:serine/threonine protein kinase